MQTETLQKCNGTPDESAITIYFLRSPSMNVCGATLFCKTDQKRFSIMSVWSYENSNVFIANKNFYFAHWFIDLTTEFHV